MSAPTPIEIRYNSGFGNEFATEAIAGALPVGRNSPQKAAFGLYAEQLSGTSFTTPRLLNKRSWLYRIRPSVTHKPFRQIENNLFKSSPFDETPATPNQLRWNPLPVPQDETDFVDGIVTIAGCGDLFAQSGLGVHVYRANKPMRERFFYNADGEMLIVPEMGRLGILTELGAIQIGAGEARQLRALQIRSAQI
jgi:homogentisate 1,2-dioxygenase